MRYSRVSRTGAGGHQTMWNRRFGIVFAAAGAKSAGTSVRLLEKHLLR